MATLAVIATGMAVTPTPASADTEPAIAHRLASKQLKVGFGADGSIQSLRINGDTFDTQYVMNPVSAPDEAAEPDVGKRQWLGNLMFSYALGDGPATTSGVGGTPWQRAWTTLSGDGRTVEQTASSVTVTYRNSRTPGGIADFTVTQRYSLAPDGSMRWSQTVDNTSGRRLTIGDWGMPIPNNETFTKPKDEIYETRVLAHSFVGRDGSFITIGRPSGIGPSLLLTPDVGTGSGFEYQDRWRVEEVGQTAWASSPEGLSNIKGLNVFYSNSTAIAATGRGYLDNTATVIDPGTSVTHGYRISAVADDVARRDTLVALGQPDLQMVPGWVLPVDQQAQLAVRVKGTITSVSARTGNDLKSAVRSDPAIRYSRANGDYRIYTVTPNRNALGRNQITVRWRDPAGRMNTSVAQLYVSDATGKALRAHAAFLVAKTQWTRERDRLAPGDIRDQTFDDWLMNARDGSAPTSDNPPGGRNNDFTGSFGLGDDWGFTHAEFLAAMNRIDPVADQIRALDGYLTTAVWQNLMGNSADSTNPSYLVFNFWEQGRPGRLGTTPIYRGYNYPHIYTTFFDMYRIAKQYPGIIRFAHPAQWYLEAAYGVMRELYRGPVGYSQAGLMGDQLLPTIVEALRDAGMTAEADDIDDALDDKYQAFAKQKYPFGSEYSYDNTGEESVYTLARQRMATDRARAQKTFRQIVGKTLATRGRMPVWYRDVVPTTINGENWWQLQYSVALAGYPLDDYVNHTAATETGRDTVTPSRRAELQRANYAAKTTLMAGVNSGQISSDPANIGASAWTYQSELGRLGTLGDGGGPNVEQLNGWRSRSGESDLGLWGVLQTMSTDVVTDDPIFGSLTYGGRSTATARSTTITPADGVNRRLNMVSQQLSVSLDTDTYRQATVAATNSALRLDMANTAGTSHTGTVRVSGLVSGAYRVSVDGKPGRTVVVAPPRNGLAPTVRFEFNAPPARRFGLSIDPVATPPNTAPAVDAGPDQTVTFGTEAITLHGSARDDGVGSGDATLASRWTVTATPVGGSARIDTAGSLRPRVTVSTPGTYSFRLSVSDGRLSSSDSVSVVVRPRPPMPAHWVHYTFDSQRNRTVPDTSGNGNDLLLFGRSEIRSDGTGSHLHLDGTLNSFAAMPENILSRCDSCTISMRFRADASQVGQKDQFPLFDITGPDETYFSLTPLSVPGVAVTQIATATTEQELDSTFRAQPGRWTTISVTIGTRGPSRVEYQMFVDGTPVSAVRDLRVAPSALGATRMNYLGLSGLGGPQFIGDIDDVRIDGLK
ncbi:DUF5695 domain-containing protein [Williamsia sp. CHRR-6]|uniref:DUF5695 domain-containing protein n=1 Tax=Williamsia sp. CHRR-6 TaxID=2835871 RepID=UPI001BDA0F02|nr:DUF5695 domain-containing protein [Williamsia sp. CHRR-6]MBT0568088.1 hypothetical protein [Williamsia sp. CHRR-6]